MTSGFGYVAIALEVSSEDIDYLHDLPAISMVAMELAPTVSKRQQLFRRDTYNESAWPQALTLPARLRSSPRAKLMSRLRAKSIM